METKEKISEPISENFQIENSLDLEDTNSKESMHSSTFESTETSVAILNTVSSSLEKQSLLDKASEYTTSNSFQSSSNRNSVCLEEPEANLMPIKNPKTRSSKLLDNSENVTFSVGMENDNTAKKTMLINSILPENICSTTSHNIKNGYSNNLKVTRAKSLKPSLIPKLKSVITLKNLNSKYLVNPKKSESLFYTPKCTDSSPLTYKNTNSSFIMTSKSSMSSTLQDPMHIEPRSLSTPKSLKSRLIVTPKSSESNFFATPKSTRYFSLIPMRTKSNALNLKNVRSKSFSSRERSLNEDKDILVKDADSKFLARVKDSKSLSISDISSMKAVKTNKCMGSVVSFIPISTNTTPRLVTKRVGSKKYL